MPDADALLGAIEDGVRMSRMIEDCEHIGSVIDDAKCYCELWGRWTNCLEVGHCTYDQTHGEEES